MITLFLSHASEDKDYVRRLADALKKAGFDPWVDEMKLTLGESILKGIQEGLHSCDYGIVVLSKHFFAKKKWTDLELDGLFALETKEKKLILPVWKDVTEDEVRDFSPILAGRLGVSTEAGIEKVVYEIKRAVGLLDRQKGLEKAWKQKFSSLDADWKHQKAADALARTTDGVRQVTKVAHEIIAEARSRVEELKGLEVVKLNVSDRYSSPFRTFIEGPRGFVMNVFFEATVTNSVLDGYFTFNVLICNQTGETIREFEFLPKFNSEVKVYWEGSGKTFITGGELLDFAFECFADLFR